MQTVLTFDPEETDPDTIAQALAVLDDGRFAALTYALLELLVERCSGKDAPLEESTTEARDLMSVALVRMNDLQGGAEPLEYADEGDELEGAGGEEVEALELEGDELEGDR